MRVKVKSAKRPKAKPRKRGPYKAKKEQIVQAAIKVFLKNGYTATSMNMVADEAGVIKQTIYNHFHDKESLFVAVIEELTIKRLKSEFASTVIKMKPEAFVRYVCQNFERQSANKQYLALVRLVVGESERFPKLAELYYKTVVAPAMQMMQAYFDAHAELEISDSYACGSVLAGSFFAWLFGQSILHGRKFAPLQAKRIADQFCCLIKMRQPASGKR